MPLVDAWNLGSYLCEIISNFQDVNSYGSIYMQIFEIYYRQTMQCLIINQSKGSISYYNFSTCFLLGFFKYHLKEFINSAYWKALLLSARYVSGVCF